MKDMLRTVFLSVIISALVTAGMIYYYDTHYALKIETVDLRGYVKSMERQRAEGEISREQLTQSVRRLSDAVKAETARPNRIVILKEVIAGGKVKEIKP